MLLKERLAEYTKDELLCIARDFDLKKCSSLRKAQLIDKIVDYFCSEECIRSRLSCLTDDEIQLYRKACKAPVDVNVDEVANAMQLYKYWLGYFDEETDYLCVVEDVANVFSRCDDKAFRDEQAKRGWLMKCIIFFKQYYGYAPIEVVHQLYSKKVKSSVEELIELLWNIPIDILETMILDYRFLGGPMGDDKYPLQSEYGILISADLLPDEEFRSLLNIQMDKPFYIPSVEQIEEICGVAYEESAPEYKALRKYFEDKLGMKHEVAVTWCLQVWANSYEGESPTEIFQRLNENNICFDEQKQVEEFVKLLMDAHNNTRMIENRGHKPSELKRTMVSGKMPTIVPVSSEAARMLSEIEPEAKKMGIHIDLDGDSDIITKTYYPSGMNSSPVHIKEKIYPNDPCPCGSGMKYKKCCAKRIN